MTVEARLFELAIPTVYRLLGKPQMRLYAEMCARDAWSADHLETFQWAAVRRLVGHAARNVPFYREMFAQLGAEPGDIKTREDYAKLPVLTKDIIRANVDRMRSDDGAEALPLLTGGSTGTPMKFFQTRAALDVGSAAWFRNYSWTGLPLGCRKFYLWGHPSDNRAAKQLRRRFERWLHRRIFFDAWTISPALVRSWVEQIHVYRPEFGYGWVSTLRAIAQMLEEDGLELPSLKVLMSTAERLDPHHRAAIERGFRCRVVDQYGSREVWSLASECIHGSMHVNADIHHVEHVEIEGGVPNLVITPLHNYAWPMLRYVNDDLASPIAGACACGKPYPRMTSVQGRTSDNFRTPDGRIVHGQYLTHLMFEVTGIREFQFVQTAVDQVLLSMVKADSFGPKTETQLVEVAAGFERYLGFPLRSVFVPEIPTAASGKRRFTVSHLWAV